MGKKKENINNEESFESFGKTFQDKLACIILRNSSFADQIQEVLNTNFFEQRYLQIFVDKIFKYKTKYKIHPSFDAIKTILKTELENDVLKDQVEEFFNTEVSVDKKIEDEEYVKEKALDFCKKQKLREAMIKSIDLLQKSSFDEISGVINDALKLGSDNNFGHDYLRDFEERYEEGQRNPISTGWQPIDNITQGGLSKGELGVIIAPTGVGKTHVLIHLASTALKLGKNVVYYTLELADVSVGKRIDACIAEFAINDLKLYKDSVYKKIKDIPGKLVIKEYPTKSISIRSIRNHIDKLKQKGFVPDIILIDYGDLLKPLSIMKERRFDLESVFEDMRALSQEHRCAVWTASQTKRDSLEKEVITMESIAESFAKCFIADFIMSLSRTMADKNSNQGRFYIAKNRAGLDGVVFPLFFDTSMSKIKVLPPENNTEILFSEGENGNGDIKRSHQQQYKQLLKNKKNKSIN